MFITFEGIEGSGKSSVMKLFADFLHDRGEMPVLTREPGGNSLGRMLRPVLLNARTSFLSPDAELYLFLADRAQHVEEVIRPALESGQTVLCDRYVDSTIAYQGYGRGMDIENLERACAIASRNVMPDHTLLLDLPVAAGITRAGERNKKEGTIITEGRFESESLDFHERVRRGYLEQARLYPERIAVIDSSRNLEAVFRSCLEKLGFI